MKAIKRIRSILASMDAHTLSNVYMPDTYSYRYDINMSHRYDRLFCVYYSAI
jgi:hypothetical protein